jgi:hypothetical protein
MGLDMYLSRRSYVKNWDFMEPKDRHKISVKKGGKIRDDIKSERISYIVEEAGYWRKFNALHGWFVNNVQSGNDDCGEYYVDTSDFQKLKEVLTEVKSNRGKLAHNEPVAESLFPATPGFFFGATEYDDYYYEMIDKTLELVEEILADDNASSYYYTSSW